MVEERDEELEWERMQERNRHYQREHENKSIVMFDTEDRRWRSEGFTQAMFNDMPREAQLFCIKSAGKIEGFITLMEDIHELSR